MLSKIQIAVLSIIMNWIMSFEILADFLEVHISCRVCGLARTLRRLSRTLDKERAASSEWFRKKDTLNQKAYYPHVILLRNNISRS